jgi:hypothetical protein
LRDHAEEAWTCSPDRPKQIGMPCIARNNEPAVCGDDVCGLDAEAAGALPAKITTKTAVQQKAAQGNGGTVADRKGKSAFRQGRIQLAASYRRLNGRGVRLRVNRDDPLQLSEVNQQAMVAQRKADPIMPAAAHGDLQPMGASKIHRRHYVMLCGGPADQRGTTARRRLIPYERAPQIFIGRIAFGGHLPGNMRLQRFAQLGAAQRDGAE